MANQNAGIDSLVTGTPDVIGSKKQSDKQALLIKVKEWELQSEEAQAANRMEMATDEDFANTKQISDEDMRILKERGQPPVQMNLIKPAIEWVVGTEKRTRMDSRVYARKDGEEESKAATSKSKLMKYMDDVNMSSYSRSRAFRDAVTCGLGWLEDGIRGDNTDELLFSRYESWRNIWYDHLGVENDLSDARFVIRKKNVDLDIAQAMWSEFSDLLANCSRNWADRSANDDEFLPQPYRNYDSQGFRVNIGSSSAHLVNNHRDRVRLVECWYREPRKVRKMHSQDDTLHGVTFDDGDDSHTSAVSEEYASVYDAIEMVVRYVIYCEDYILEDGDSPYAHNQFPFTPIWAYRDPRDNSPYGMTRNMRDAQKDYNARSSKALHILASNKVIAERGSVDDEDELERIASNPNAIIWLTKGFGRDQKFFEIKSDNALAEEHIMLMNQRQEYMTRTSGVTDENLGQESNAISGKAIIAKQNEGSVVTYTLFDMLRFAMQLQGQKRLSLIEQFYDGEKQFRIIGDDANPEYVSVNQPQMDPVTGQWRVMNDITHSASDYLIDTASFSQSIRQAQHEAISETIKALPDPNVQLKFLDLLFESSELSNKAEWVRRAKALNGEVGEEDDMEPEELEALQRQKQEEAEMAQMEKDSIQSEIDERRAKTEKLQAETTAKKVESVASATEAAATMASMPAVAPITDTLLESAGFVDEIDIASIDIPRPQPQVAPQAQAEAQEHTNPSPQVDPNKAMAIESSTSLQREKMQADKESAKNEKP